MFLHDIVAAMTMAEAKKSVSENLSVAGTNFPTPKKGDWVKGKIGTAYEGQLGQVQSIDPTRNVMRQGTEAEVWWRSAARSEWVPLKWLAKIGGAKFNEEELNELSPDTLASYKKKAGASATAADAAGDYEKGHKRFKGIVKATNKEFDKTAKKDNSLNEFAPSPKFGGDNGGGAENMPLADIAKAIMLHIGDEFTVEKGKRRDQPSYKFTPKDPTKFGHARIWCMYDRSGGEYPTYNTTLFKYTMGHDGRLLATGSITESAVAKTNQNALRTAELIYNNTDGALKQGVAEATATSSAAISAQVGKVLKNMGFRFDSKETTPTAIKSWWRPANPEEVEQPNYFVNLAKALSAVDPTVKVVPNWHVSDADQISQAGELGGSRFTMSWQPDEGYLFVGLYKQTKQGKRGRAYSQAGYDIDYANENVEKGSDLSPEEIVRTLQVYQQDLRSAYSTGESNQRIRQLKAKIAELKSMLPQGTEAPKLYAASPKLDKQQGVAEAFQDDGKMDWDAWKQKAKQHGAVKFVDTDNKTIAYDKNSKQVSSITWSSKKKGVSEEYDTNEQNREYFDNVQEWAQAVQDFGADVIKTRGVYVANGWAGEAGEFDPSTGEGWLVSKVVRAGVAEGEYSENQIRDIMITDLEDAWYRFLDDNPEESGDVSDAVAYYRTLPTTWIKSEWEKMVPVKYRNSRLLEMATPDSDKIKQQTGKLPGHIGKLDRLKHDIEREGVTEDAEQLSVGDDVIITGDVRFNGATGVIDSFGRDNRFVVVNLYNHGKHSFHSSDVSYNEYADSDDEEARMYDRGEFTIDDEMDEDSWNDGQNAWSSEHNQWSNESKNYYDKLLAERAQVKYAKINSLVNELSNVIKGNN